MKKILKKLATVVCGGTLVLAGLTGCSSGQTASSGSTESASSTAAPEKEDTASEDVASEEAELPWADGKIVMGTNAAFPPFEYIEDNEFKGFDIELSKLIADKLGVELVIDDMEFGSLLIAVDTGKVDFVAAGMTATDERAKQVDFSTTYFESVQMLIVKEDDDSIQELADLEGKKVGVQLGTTGDLFLGFEQEEGLDVSIERFDKAALAIMELNNGKVDAVMIDEFPAYKFVESNPGLKLVEAPFVEEEYAIAVKKGNEELLEVINEVIDEIKADGTYDALYEEFFGEIE